MAQTQEEFYFSLPYQQIDICLYALNEGGVPAETVAGTLGLDVGQVDHVFRDIQSKRRATAYQHAPPLLVPSAR